MTTASRPAPPSIKGSAEMMCPRNVICLPTRSSQRAWAGDVAAAQTVNINAPNRRCWETIPLTAHSLPNLSRLRDQLLLGKTNPQDQLNQCEQIICHDWP